MPGFITTALRTIRPVCYRLTLIDDTVKTVQERLNLWTGTSSVLLWRFWNVLEWKCALAAIRCEVSVTGWPSQVSKTNVGEKKQSRGVLSLRRFLHSSFGDRECVQPLARGQPQPIVSIELVINSKVIRRTVTSAFGPEERCSRCAFSVSTELLPAIAALALRYPGDHWQGVLSRPLADGHCTSASLEKPLAIRNTLQPLCWHRSW